MDHHAPNLKVVARLDARHSIVRVCRAQLYVAIRRGRGVEVFHRKLAVPQRHDNLAVASLDSAVNDNAVAIEDAGIFH